jgi:hypothetical protein
MQDAELPPPIGLLEPIEVELIDAAIPSVATGNDTPLLNALEAIMHTRMTPEQWARYLELPDEQRRAILRGVAQEIPAIAHVGW